MDRVIRRNITIFVAGFFAFWLVQLAESGWYVFAAYLMGKPAEIADMADNFSYPARWIIPSLAITIESSLAHRMLVYAINSFFINVFVVFPAARWVQLRFAKNRPTTLGLAINAASDEDDVV